MSALRPNVCECGHRGDVLDARDSDGARRRRFQCTGPSCNKRWSTIEARIPDGVQYAGRGPNAPSFIWIPGTRVDTVLDNLGVKSAPETKGGG